VDSESTSNATPSEFEIPVSVHQANSGEEASTITAIQGLR
jgi:hypothetical protein